MNYFYFDASALVKRYAPELGSDLVNYLFSCVTHKRLMCLIIGVAELFSVLVRKKNREDISVPDFSQALINLGNEVIHTTDFTTVSIEDSLVLSSLPLINKHSINSTDAVVLRSALDIAVELQAVEDDLIMIVSDQRLLRAAKSEGLIKFNPESGMKSELDALLV
jgi:predicted nucleic acid-binding protein